MLLTWKSALPKSFGVAAHRTNASLLTADGGHDGRCLGRAGDHVNARERVCRRPPGASGKTLPSSLRHFGKASPQASSAEILAFELENGRFKLIRTQLRLLAGQQEQDTNKVRQSFSGDFGVCTAETASTVCGPNRAICGSAMLKAVAVHREAAPAIQVLATSTACFLLESTGIPDVK